MASEERRASATGTGVLTSEEIDAVRQLRRSLGKKQAAIALKLSIPSVDAILSGEPVHRMTADYLRARLAERDAAR